MMNMRLPSVCLLAMLFLPTVIQAQSLPDIDDFEQLESVTDYLELLDEAHDGMRALSHFMVMDDDPVEPDYTEPLTPDFDADAFAARFKHMLEGTVTFTQTPYDKSESSISFDNSDAIRELDTDVVLRPLRYHFHDGTTVAATEDDDSELDGIFSDSVPVGKTLLRMDVSASANPSNDLRQIEFAAKPSTREETALGTFEVVASDKRQVMLKSEVDSDDIITVRATTKDGRTVSSNSMMQTSGGTPDELRQALDDFTRALDKIRKAAHKDENMPLDTFKKKYNARIESLTNELESLIDDEDTYYISYTFGVPVTDIQLYYRGDSGPWEGEMTLVNAHPQSLYVENDEDDDTIIYNADYDVVAHVSGEFWRINDAYFEDDQRFYHFDQDAGSMQSLDYYDVESMPANHALAKMDAQADWELLDAAGQQQLKDIVDYQEDDDVHVVMLQTDASYYLLSAESETPKPLDYDKVSQAGAGYFKVKKGDKYGYADASGKLIIPTQYDDVGRIDAAPSTNSQALFPVQQDHLWGFVDDSNRVVIAPQYEGIVGGFAYDIAIVQDTHGGVGLITAGNCRIVGFDNGNYMISGSGDKRQIGLSDGNYDYQGRRTDDDGDESAPSVALDKQCSNVD